MVKNRCVTTVVNAILAHANHQKRVAKAKETSASTRKKMHTSNWFWLRKTVSQQLVWTSLIVTARVSLNRPKGSVRLIIYTFQCNTVMQTDWMMMTKCHTSIRMSLSASKRRQANTKQISYEKVIKLPYNLVQNNDEFERTYHLQYTHDVGLIYAWW